MICFDGASYPSAGQTRCPRNAAGAICAWPSRRIGLLESDSPLEGSK